MKQLAFFHSSHLVARRDVEQLPAVPGTHHFPRVMSFADVLNSCPLCLGIATFRRFFREMHSLTAETTTSFFNFARECDWQSRCGYAFCNIRTGNRHVLFLRCGHLDFLVRFNCAPNSLTTSAVQRVVTLTTEGLRALSRNFACLTGCILTWSTSPHWSLISCVLLSPGRFGPCVLR